MFKFLFKKRSEDLHAAKLYTAVLAQSRKPEFYGAGRIDDSYDGRIDLLSLNLGVIMQSLTRFGSDGQALTQALYDVMVEDFNIAMREEGLADTGISRRIKPMIAKFYDRLRGLTQALKGEDTLHAYISEQFLGEQSQDAFTLKLSNYAQQSADSLSLLNLNDIQSANFQFPDL